MVPIIEIPMPKTKYGIKCPYTMTPTRVIIHNTANDASARNEVSYMQNNYNEAGFHYAVDDKEIILASPLTRMVWNAGDGSNGIGNRQGIAIEICYSKSGGAKFEKAQENAAELTAKILKERNWDITKVTKHQDYSGKHCPHRTLDQYGWTYFINLVKKYLGEKPVEPVVVQKVDALYRVKTQKHGWLSEVKNLEDYAGYQNSPITDISIKASLGTIKYRVHVKGGKWLPWVTGYNIKDHNNGYAGNGKPIDAIQIIYTPKKGQKQRAKYRIMASGKTAYWSWQYNNETTGEQDGYAGAFGTGITRFQMEIK